MGINFNNEEQKWHAVDVEKVLSALNTDAATGLTGQEAAVRLDKFGPNTITRPKRKSAFLRFLMHFNDVLIYVLLGAAVVTAILGHYADTVVIVLVAIINSAIGFFQEQKAEKALESIKNMLSPKAHVLREGVRLEIEAAELTVGDIVRLNPGDKIPADLRLIKTDNLKIEESALTGESLAVNKNPASLAEDALLGDRKNMAYSSTSVRAGTGLGIVVAVGADTEIGKINQLLAGVDKVTTPLIRQTSQFGKVVSIFIVLVAVVIFIFAYFFRDYPMYELLLSVIGLLIAGIPEGLPAILSIILALGVQNMAKRKAIVRSLPSVETLGSVSVICSDKTGTLTKNEMTVTALQTRDHSFEVTGTGYAPEGEILLEGNKADLTQDSPVRRLIDCFNACNDSDLGQDKNGQWSVKGDPTEGALITLYQKANMEHREHTRLATLPFDSEYKYMAILVEGKEENVILVKGAPDRLLALAAKEFSESGEKDFDISFWENKINELANKGQRIIGAGYIVVGKSFDHLSRERIDNSKEEEGDFVFLGLAGMIDPPREEAVEAVKVCKEAGITVKMITGDHIETAKAIGRDMGIGDGKKALSGKELEEMSDEDLAKVVVDYDIFARTSPEHKIRIVNALQSRGIICAMTGDGVNDAPALKKSDIGVAMGIKGTDVTKDTAEIVLADDNFATIVAAVEEGRRVYANLKKTILFVLPTNGAESFLIMASIIFATMMPLTPIQILWVNMVTSITLSFALAFENAEPGIMKMPPRSPNVPLLDGYFIWRIIFLSVFVGGGTLALSVYLFNAGYEEGLVRTVTVQTIVMAQAFHLFNSRSIRAAAFNKDFFSNKAVFVVWAGMLLLQISVTYLPFMNSIFGTVPVALRHWGYSVVFGIIVFIVIEIEKALMRHVFLKGKISA